MVRDAVVSAQTVITSRTLARCHRRHFGWVEAPPPAPRRCCYFTCEFFNSPAKCICRALVRVLQNIKLMETVIIGIWQTATPRKEFWNANLVCDEQLTRVKGTGEILLKVFQPLVSRISKHDLAPVFVVASIPVEVNKPDVSHRFAELTPHENVFEMVPQEFRAWCESFRLHNRGVFVAEYQFANRMFRSLLLQHG